MKKSQQFKPYQFQLSEEIFKSAVFIMVNRSYDSMIRYVQKKFPNFELPKHLSNSLGLCFSHKDKKSGILYSFVWVKKFDWTIGAQGCYLHELCHFIWHLIDEKNMVASHNDEPYCYLFEYYMKESWKKLQRFYK